MEGRLHEAGSGGAGLVGAIEDGLHESAADAKILRGAIDGDGADAANAGAFVKAVAAHDAVVDFRDDAVEAGVGEQVSVQADGGFRRGKSRGKPCASLRIEKAS